MAKFKITRSFYTPRQDIIRSAKLDNGIEYYPSGKTDGSITVTAFSFKRQKPDVYVLCRTLKHAEDVLNQWLKNVNSHLEYKAKRQEQIKAARTNGAVKVGDIFIASWGYEQTNIDAYQVVGVVGKATVVVRKIATKGVPGTEGFMCQNVVAVPNHFVGKEDLRRRISANADGASIKISSCETAHYEKEIRPHYCSWYA